METTVNMNAFSDVFEKEIEKTKDAQSKEDKAMHLCFDFKLTNDVKSMLQKHTSYYRNDNIISDGIGGNCIHCGKRIFKGELYVEDNPSAVSCHLKCAGTNITIDGKDMQIKQSVGNGI